MLHSTQRFVRLVLMYGARLIPEVNSHCQHEQCLSPLYFQLHLVLFKWNIQHTGIYIIYTWYLLILYMCVLGTLSSIPKKNVLATSRPICQLSGSWLGDGIVFIAAWHGGARLSGGGRIQLIRAWDTMWYDQKQLNVSQQTWWQMSFGQWPLDKYTCENP